MQHPHQNETNILIEEYKVINVLAKKMVNQ